MKNHAYVSILKNLRYRSIRHGSHNYLLDLEQNKYYFIFPFLLWTDILKVYQLDQEALMNLEKIKHRTNFIDSLMMLIVGLSFVLGKMVVSAGFIQIEFLNSIIGNVIFLLLMTSIVVVFRIRQHRKNEEKMQQLLAVEKLNIYYIKLYPKKIKGIIFPLFMWVFFIFFTYMSILLAIKLHLLIGIIGYWGFLSIVFIAFRLFIHSNYEYTISYYE